MQIRVFDPSIFGIIGFWDLALFMVLSVSVLDWRAALLTTGIVGRIQTN